MWIDDDSDEDKDTLAIDMVEALLSVVLTTTGNFPWSLLYLHQH
jgi:hypothetical protein